MTSTRYTSVADTTVVSILARENPNRRELMISNNSSSILYLAFERLPSSTDWSARLMPYDVFITGNKDRVNGVWSADSTGQANISEESND